MRQDDRTAMISIDLKSLEYLTKLQFLRDLWIWYKGPFEVDFDIQSAGRILLPRTDGSLLNIAPITVEIGIRNRSTKRQSIRRLEVQFIDPAEDDPTRRIDDLKNPRDLDPESVWTFRYILPPSTPFPKNFIVCYGSMKRQYFDFPEATAVDD